MTEEIDKIGFGARVKQFRENMGISQSEFSAMLNIQQASLSRIERGESGALVSTLHAICVATKTSADFFLGLPTTGETLLPQERALIEAFRKLSTKRKYDVINIVEGFVSAETASAIKKKE